MLEEIIISVEDRPGVLAEVGELLGRSGVNIETLSASSHNGQGILHLVVDDGDDASEMLKTHGFQVVGVREVMTATLDDQPGALGQYCRKLSDAGIAISSVYLARRAGGEAELVFAVDDVEAAQKA